MIARACFLFVLVSSVSLPCAFAQDSTTEEARRHFDAGTQAFDTGDYEVAVSEFRASYELTHHPDLLFNIYSSAERAGHLDEAADALRQFLAEGELEPERRPALEQRLARLRERIAAASSGVEAPPDTTEPPDEHVEPDPTPPPQPAHSGGPHPAAIGTLIGAGVLAAAFGVFAALSEVEDGRLASDCGRDAGRTCTDAQVSTLRAYDIVADVSWITAAVAGVTGLILLFALPPEGGSTGVALAPWAAPGGAGAVLAGRF